MTPPANFPGEPDASPEIAREFGLSNDEWKLVLDTLSRTP